MARKGRKRSGGKAAGGNGGGRGRPPGSTSGEVVTVEVARSRCPRCGGTERSDYWGKTVQAFSGLHNGQPFRQIVRRRCRCLGCGQVRIDKEYL